MGVIFYEAAVQRLLRSPLGAVGRDLARRAENVTRQAAENASGPIIGIESGDLHSGIHFTIEEGPTDLVAAIGTPARHRGFGYPAYWDQHGRPWLSDALKAFEP